MPYPYYPQQPYYVPPMQDQMRNNYQVSSLTPQNSIIWVQGEAGARAYLVANGNTVDLWDSEAPIIYIKSVDASGVPSMRVLEYTERSVKPSGGPLAPKVEYVTHDELEAAVRRLEGLMADSAPTPAKRQKGDRKDDE